MPVQSVSKKVFFLDIDRFHFKSIGFDSDILYRAFDRCNSCTAQTNQLELSVSSYQRQRCPISTLVHACMQV